MIDQSALIRKLIEVKVETWAAAYGIEVGYENVNFTPANRPYISLYIIPANTVLVGLSADYTLYKGLISFVIGATANEANAATDAIVASLSEAFVAFVDDSELIDVETGLQVVITTPMRKSQGSLIGNEYSTTVRCGYRCDNI